MATWKFYCEWKSNIPLPPDYTFAQAFNYLSAEKNSFYILERDNGEFIQCGGGKAACTVEVRMVAPNHLLTHYVLGRSYGTDAKAEIQMSNGAVAVLQRQILNHREAIRLFDCFFRHEPFPAEYSLFPRNV